MKISLSWLQDFVDITEKDLAKVKSTITTSTAEIETMETLGAHLDKVVVGKIVELKPHPNADKLRLTLVDVGSEKLKVVCGGSNLKEGMKVALAQIGAVVKWHGTETVKMEPAKIRGEESFGMICGADEIGLEELFPKKGEKEIVDLSALDVKPGTPLAEALGLGDTVIDVDNHAITHRPDLFSHRGFAREFVATGMAKWRKARSSKLAAPSNHSPAPIEIEVTDPELCSNYLGVYMTGIEIGPSPEWMKKRLSACGIRPLANIIDITNYVMLELGMPMHAFDLDQVKGKKWTMRKSKKGEKVITLDKREIELFEGVTVLDDGNEIFDLCGIMGGFNSGINGKTNRIWLHAPVYHPTLIRRAMRGLAQITDASIIYEKGVDAELAQNSLNRAIQLIQELIPGAKVASAVTEIRPHKLEKRSLTLRTDRLEKMSGLKFPGTEVKRILTDLGFGLTKAKNGYKVAVPSWRLGDVNWEADLIEEVVRIHGINEVPAIAPVTDITPIAINAERVFARSLKDRLTAMGFNELYTFAFVGAELLKKCNLKPDHATIEVGNPLSQDMALMRQSLLPRTMEAVASNLRFQKQFRVFEISRVFAKKGHETEEKTELIAATACPELSRGTGEDFRSIQGVIETLGLTVKPMESSHAKAWQHPGRTAQLAYRGEKVGELYEIHPTVERAFDLKSRVVVAEVDFAKWMAKGADTKIHFREIPKFPSIQLDISVQIPRKKLAEEFTHAIAKTDRELIKEIRIVDEYMGDKIDKDARSLTYSITYRSDKETLTEAQVTAIHQKVLANLKTQGAVIRV